MEDTATTQTDAELNQEPIETPKEEYGFDSKEAKVLDEQKMDSSTLSQEQIDAYANPLADLYAFSAIRKFDTWAQEPWDGKPGHLNSEQPHMSPVDWHTAINPSSLADFEFLASGQFDKITERDMLKKGWNATDWSLVKTQIEKK